MELPPESAARLIETQLPTLAPARLDVIGVGWDNTAYRVNDRFVFRFPRRRLGADLIATETRALPMLAPLLPLPIPVPRYVGTPAGGYPYPFCGYEMIPGTPACRAAWTDSERDRLAAPLGGFLAALHRIPVTAEDREWAPGDTIGRTDMRGRLTRIRARMPAMHPLPDGIRADAVLGLMARLAESAPDTGPGCWVHGDLYGCHVLINDDRNPAGVIDWGDVHVGDLALDLSIAWSFLPPSARSGFRAAYGKIDDSAWSRARFRALHYGVLLHDYGAAIGDDAMRETGETALRLALTG